MPSSTNRRTFLLAAGAAATAYAASPPIRTAFIGVGNRGTNLLGQTLQQSDVAIKAICDLDPGARDSALSKAAEHKPRAYTDWREIVDLKDVDAVKIATPCYLHAEMAAACLDAGKYVYCEKPLSHVFDEGPLVVAAAQKHKRYTLTHMADVDATPCPCGSAKRAFMDEPDGIASLHVTQIKSDSKVHYHKIMTELYYVLEGQGVMELDGDEHTIEPGSAVMIRPGCRHRAVGQLTMLIVPIPAFDPEDEWFD